MEVLVTNKGFTQQNGGFFWLIRNEPEIWPLISYTSVVTHEWWEHEVLWLHLPETMSCLSNQIFSLWILWPMIEW